MIKEEISEYQEGRKNNGKSKNKGKYERFLLSFLNYA